MTAPTGALIAAPQLTSIAQRLVTGQPLGTRPSATGNVFIERALEASGVPVLPIVADMVDARGWNGLEMRQRVGQFLEGLNLSAGRDRA